MERGSAIAGLPGRTVARPCMHAMRGLRIYDTNAGRMWRELVECVDPISDLSRTDGWSLTGRVVVVGVLCVDVLAQAVDAARWHSRFGLRRRGSEYVWQYGTWLCMHMHDN